jgi:hypothetical protein
MNDKLLLPLQPTDRMIWKVLQDVLIMNNECVQQLNDDNLLEGLHILQRAVAILREVAAIQTSFTSASTFGVPTQKESVNALTTTACNTTSVLIQERNGFPSRHLSVALSTQRAIGEDSVTHNRPLLLYLAQSPTAVDTNSNISQGTVNFNDHGPDSAVFTLLSATIIFNLALICHRFGMIFGQDTSLSRATKLYMVVIEMINERPMLSSTMDDANSTNRDGKGTAALVLTLAFNNLGQVQYELCNYPGYHRCMMILRNLFMNHRKTFDVVLNRFAEDDPTDVSMMEAVRMNLLFWQFLSPSVAYAA